MPVQINEMVIRANIVESLEKTKEMLSNPSKGESGRADMVQECVEKVLEIINQKYQR